MYLIKGRKNDNAPHDPTPAPAPAPSQFGFQLPAPVPIARTFNRRTLSISPLTVRIEHYLFSTSFPVRQERGLFPSSERAWQQTNPPVDSSLSPLNSETLSTSCSSYRIVAVHQQTSDKGAAAAAAAIAFAQTCYGRVDRYMRKRHRSSMERTCLWRIRIC